MTFHTHHAASQVERDHRYTTVPLVIPNNTRDYIHVSKGDGCCGYCGDQLEHGKRAVDHMIPWRRGGTNDPENLIPACTTCNVQKKDRLVEEFRVWLMLDKRRMRTGAPNFTADQINWLAAKGFDVFEGVDRIVFHFEKNPSIWLPLPREFAPANLIVQQETGV